MQDAAARAQDNSLTAISLCSFLPLFSAVAADVVKLSGVFQYGETNAFKRSLTESGKWDVGRIGMPLSRKYKAEI